MPASVSCCSLDPYAPVWALSSTRALSAEQACTWLLKQPMLLVGAENLEGGQAHRVVAETWWSRWVRWWHGSQLEDRSPGHLWDPYLPRTTPEEVEVLPDKVL